MKLLDTVAVEATRLNTRGPHLEKETIFGSAKQKLDLPPRDESNSHSHDRINYSVPKLGKGLSPSQVQLLGRSFSIPSEELSSVKSSNPSSVSQKSKSIGWRCGPILTNQVLTCSGYPIF